jgi:hypothetical protein
MIPRQAPQDKPARADDAAILPPAGEFARINFPMAARL